MEDPIPTFTYLISQFAETHSNLAYISLVDPRVSGDSDQEVRGGESNKFAYDIWNPRPLLLGGGWTTDPVGAAREADEKGIIPLFGRAFIANVRERGSFSLSFCMT